MIHVLCLLTKTPHVDRRAVGKTEYHFGRAVEPRLDVSVDPLVLKAAAAEVNHLDGRCWRVRRLQQYVLLQNRDRKKKESNKHSSL